jgi:hypothetical protein
MATRSPEEVERLRNADENNNDCNCLRGGPFGWQIAAAVVQDGKFSIF